MTTEQQQFKVLDRVIEEYLRTHPEGRRSEITADRLLIFAHQRAEQSREIEQTNPQHQELVSRDWTGRTV